MKEEYEQRVAKAVEYFMNGYGCCQSVVAAFADIYGFTTKQALQIGAGFGGGVGKLRMMCGAVSGLVVLAGMECGDYEGSDREGKAECYKVVQDLIEQFSRSNGSIICAELLGLKGPLPKGDYMPSERTRQYYRVRPCVAKVECAARIFAGYLDNQNNKNILV